MRGPSRFVQGALVVTALALVVASCGQPPGTGTEDPGGSADTDTSGADPSGADPSDADFSDAAIAVDVERAPVDVEGSAQVQELVAGLNDVGYRVFGVAADDTDDVVLSPLSIGVAFGMADVGASGETATALEELFAYPVDVCSCVRHWVRTCVGNVGVLRLALVGLPPTFRHLV